MEKRSLQSLTRLLAALAICALPVSAQTVKDLPALSAVTRELKGGETYSYRLTMTSGQFLHAIVEQLNMDVVTAVFAPDGKQLTESDSPNDDLGSEPIIFIAPTYGEYRFDMRSPYKEAATGRYQIKIVALREATAIKPQRTGGRLVGERLIKPAPAVGKALCARVEIGEGRRQFRQVAWRAAAGRGEQDEVRVELALGQRLERELGDDVALRVLAPVGGQPAAELEHLQRRGMAERQVAVLVGGLGDRDN